MGSLSTALTIPSAGGFGVSGILATAKWLKGEKTEQDAVKNLHPGTFLFLSGLLSVACMYSGGTGAYAGFSQFTRLLTDLGFNELAEYVPQIFEALGFAGAFGVNISYGVDLSTWLLEMYDAKFGKGIERDYVNATTGVRNLNNILANLTLENVEDLAKHGVFGDEGQLLDLGMTEEELEYIDVLIDPNSKNFISEDQSKYNTMLHR